MNSNMTSVEDQENNWSGEFTSTYYSRFIWPFVSGTISISLPNDVTQSKNLQATLKYNGWYRSKQLSHLNISYREDLRMSNMGSGFQIGFTGAGVTTFQKITFAIVSYKKDKQGKMIEMTGLYKSESPLDQGSWSLSLNHSQQ